MKLTVKQEAFCLAYIETGNASEAYRRAGYSNRASEKTTTEAACRLLKNSNVIARVAELQAKAVERHEITVDDLIAELDEARMAGLGALIPQTSAAVAATMGKAKLLGMLVEKMQHSGKDGQPIDMSVTLNFVKP